ncbi:ABC transporter ATP-binding protein [Zeimonas arvi]|uniref:ABC transporter ATP-binding protein n=1 Tax=Zeimonas arvi TaxID=2498847 RepID=A0A5C8NWB9_9BURK|nr:ABC transporter ATP-binding protein [Zeimonas arvi]TXL65474.1 ABC transporter ATP-binding protein [Zeimonas arvi]
MPGSTLPGFPVLSRDFLVLDRIRFGYREREILKDISLRFERGKVVALIGGSGCGKTTILRLIGGQLRPQQGSVSFDGQDVHKLDREGLFALRKRMGMLYQFGALFTDLTAFENVAFPLREHTDLTDPMIRDLVLMKLEAVGLRGAAQFGISQLSGGMARRVALARAIALDPPLIMYDEPFAGLDPVALATVANLIRRLADSLNCASILVSHDIKDTFAIADYVYLLAAGRVAAEGTPDELRDSDDPNVRQFLEGDIDGPIAFHYQAPPLAEDLGLKR